MAQNYTLKDLNEALDNGSIDQTTYDTMLEALKDSSSISARTSPDYQQNTVTTPGEKTSSTSSQADSTSSSTQTSYNQIAGIRYHEDGTPFAEDVQARKDADAAMLTKSFNLSDAIGAKREKIRKQREKEATANARRAKVAAWADSARVIGDIISAGVGGNVYAREKDTTAKEMNERNKALRDLQAAEDAQAAMQEWQANRDRALAILQNNQRIDQLTAVQRATHSQKGTQKTSQNGKSSQGSSASVSWYSGVGSNGTQEGAAGEDKKDDKEGNSSSMTMPGVTDKKGKSAWDLIN